MFENINFVEILESIAGGATKVLPWAFPIALIYVAYRVGMTIYALAMENQVIGEPNEWVVVLRDGKQIHAQQGLNCFKRPNDTVAKFPSGVREINFNAMQVTKEMQGLDVQATLAWTIYREGDGPSRAYKNLGADIKNQVPTKTNDKITTLAQAVVRHVIANNELNTVIKNREILTSEITAKLKPLLKGWGMWLERVDIKDVRICSASLFQDLQC